VSYPEWTAHLIRLGRPAVAHLLPGATLFDVHRILGEQVPAEVAEWFATWNGIADVPGHVIDDICVIPGYWPVRLDEVPAWRHTHAGDPALGDHWVPLLVGGGADMYAAVWTPDTRPYVVDVLVGEPTEIAFGSIAAFVEYVVTCFELGAFRVGDDGWFAEEPELCERILRDVAI
jgi:hypothetical protein